MKRNIFNILLLAGAAVALSSCKDDDDKKEPNVLKIGDASTTISAGAFIYDTSLGGENDDIYLHYVYLLGEGLSIVGEEPSGKGNAVSLGVVSSTTSLEPGTYEFTGTDIDAAPFDFWDGSAYIDFNSDESEELGFTEGTITISKSGDVYTIDVTGVSGETAITCHFSGKLVSIEN